MRYLPQILAFLFGFAMLARSQTCEAQVRNAFEAAPRSEPSVFLPPPRDLLRPLIRASKAIEEGDTRRAVDLLGEILSNPAPQDYLVPAQSPPGAEGVFISLSVRASDMLGALSSKDREPYRLRYGTPARLLLEEAIEANDYQKMAMLMRRYFYTDAGGLATMLLGHYFLDTGRPSAAETCFQKIVDFEESAKKYQPEASLILATCQMLAGKTDQAKSTLVQWKLQHKRATVSFDGRQIPVFAQDPDSVKWLQELIGKSSFRRVAKVDQWLMPGGNPARNAQTTAGFPLIRPLWKLPTVNDAAIQQQIADRQQELTFLDAAPIPAVQTLAVNDTLVLRGLERMFGVDVRSGKRTWVYPPGNLSSRDANEVRADTQKVNIPITSLTERLWQDSIYGQTSSNGKLVFVVPRPGFAGKQSNRFDEKLFQAIGPVFKRTTNELTAIDVERQGAIQWTVGGENGLDEPKLANAFFLGAPLPIEDSLFVVCQQKNRIRLVELDASTGRLISIQDLASIDTGVDILDDRYRRLGGVTPSFSDGVLVCATGSGALAGIDLATRSLLWGFQFASPSGKDVTRISPNQRVSQMVLGGLWRDTAITISEGTVLFTPVDSQNLICIDLQTGFPKWKNEGRYISELPRRDSLYVACIENGNAILVGRSALRAVRLSDGFPIWEQNIETYGRPSGRGYSDGGAYFLPTTSQHILQFELSTGKIVKSVRTDGMLGNLICYDGKVISHGAEWFSCYEQDRNQRQLVKSAETKGEMSPQLLAVQSQLQFIENDIAGATESLAKAYEESGKQQFVADLKSVIIELVKTDFAGGMVYANRYEKELQLNRSFEFNAAKIDGLIQSGKTNQAFDTLMTLLKGEEPFDSSTRPVRFLAQQYDLSSTEPDKQPTSLRSTRASIEIQPQYWIASRFQILIDKTESKDQIGQFTASSNQHLEELAQRNPNACLNQLHLFPTKLVSNDLRLSLAMDLTDQRRNLAANALMDQVLRSGTDEQRTSAHAFQAQLLISQKMYAQAQVAISQLVDADPTTQLANGRSLKQWLDEWTAKLPSQPERPLINDALPYTDAWHQHFQTEPNVRFQVLPNEVHLVECDEPVFKQYRYQFYTHTGEFEVSDENGKLIRRFLARRQIHADIPPVNNYVFGQLRIQDQIGILTIGTELFAFDLFHLKTEQDPVLWNHLIRTGEKDQSSTLPAVSWGETRMSTRRINYEKKVFAASPSPQGTCFLDGTHLICVDTFTGIKRWQRTHILPRSMLYGDDEKVVVWNSNRRNLTIIDILTGRQLKNMTFPPELGALWVTQGTRLLLTGIERADQNETGDKDQPKTGTQAKDVNTPKPVVKTVGLFDLVEESFVWQRRFEQKSVGCLVRNEQLVVLPPQGRLEFIDLSNGETRIYCPIELAAVDRAAVDGLGITTNSSTYLLHIKRGNVPGRVDLPQQQIRIRNLHYYDTFWTGFLYCVDRTLGKPVWKRPIRFDNFQVAKAIPDRLPFHVLVRRYERRNKRNQLFLQLLFLDVKSGMTIANVTMPYVFRNHYWMEWTATTGELEIRFIDQQLSIRFDRSSDAAPRPMASISNGSTIGPPQAQINRYAVSEETREQELEWLKQQAIADEKKIQALKAKTNLNTNLQK